MIHIRILMFPRIEDFLLVSCRCCSASTKLAIVEPLPTLCKFTMKRILAIMLPSSAFTQSCQSFQAVLCAQIESLAVELAAVELLQKIFTSMAAASAGI